MGQLLYFENVIRKHPLSNLKTVPVLFPFIMGITLILATSFLFGQRSVPVATEINGHRLTTLLRPGDIPAIFTPEFISVSDAERLYDDSEPLMVVMAGDEVKGYSTWHLDHHEVVNDYIGGLPIVSTW